MIVFFCYLILISITLYTIVISKILYNKCQSLIPIVPILVIYFWSIYGAWTWIPFKLNGETYFYEDMMYTVNVDVYYCLSLLYYSIFIVIFGNYVLTFALRRRKDLSETYYRSVYMCYIERLTFSRGYHFVMYVMLFVFLYFSYSDIYHALRSGVSAYQLSRFDSTTEGLNSLISFCGNTFVYLSVPLLFSKNFKKKIPVLLGFSIYYFFNFMLGNRNILLCGMIVAVLLYSELYGVKKALKLKNICFFIILVLIIQIISIFRGFSADAMFSSGFKINISDILMSLFTSSEQYCAQFSMYGALKYDVDFTYGSSILFLMSTLIPSFLGFERPMAIYQHFIKNTVGSADLGMTINHATGWYLNFGIVGIVIGAWLWGYILKYFYCRKKSFIYLYGAVTFSSSAIQMIRDGGIEAYKSGLLLDTIIPLSIIWWFTKRNRKSLSI